MVVSIAKRLTFFLPLHNRPVMLCHISLFSVKRLRKGTDGNYENFLSFFVDKVDLIHLNLDSCTEATFKKVSLVRCLSGSSGFLSTCRA